MARFFGRSRINERQDLRAAAVTLLVVCVLFAACTMSRDIQPVALVAFCLAIVAALVPTRIDVGADGVRIAWLGTRFVSFRDVSAVRASKRDAVLELGSGARVVLPIAPKNKRAGAEARRDELIARIGDALREYEREIPGVHQLEAALARVRVGDERSDAYRSYHLAEESLWRVVETPAASTLARVRAAVALSPTLDDAARKRIAIAADAVCSPETRRVLQKLAARRLLEGESTALLESAARSPSVRGPKE